MTNKVQTIKEWVKTRKLCTMDEHMKFYCKEAESDYNLLCRIEEVLDSLQEEPVSERFAFKAIPRLLEMIEPTDRAKAYTAKLADALETEGYLTDAKIVRESLKIMNGEKVPMATMDEEHISEDFEEAINKSFIYHENRGDDFRIDEQIETAYRYGFESGAGWKEQQFEKNRLAHCDDLTAEQAQIESDFVVQHLKKYNRTPTFIDAIEYGMRLQKEKIMKDAVDGTMVS